MKIKTKPYKTIKYIILNIKINRVDREEWSENYKAHIYY